MAGYGGYFLRGLAGGIQSGLNMGQQVIEMKWQKAQKKKLQERQDKLVEAGNIFNAKVKEFGADNIFNDDEVGQLTTIYLAGGYEFQEHYQNAMNYISGMKDKEFNQELEWMDSFIDMTSGLSPDSIPDIYNNFERQFITSEKGKTLFAANKRIQEKKYETLQAQPIAKVFPTAEAVQAKYPNAGYKYDSAAGGYVPTFQKPEATPTTTDYNSAINYLLKFKNAPPETFSRIKAGYQKQFPNIDMAEITQEVLKGIDTATKKYYTSAKEAMANSPDFEGLIKQPVQVELDKWKIDYMKKTTPTPLIVKVVDPNDVLFGTNGIMRNYIGSGSQLGEEQRIEIRNNYELVRPSLNEDVKKQVETYLKQIGIDVTKPIPEPDVIPKKKPFWQADWKYYQNLTKEELYYLADKKDDIKAYEELKKRGFIK